MSMIHLHVTSSISYRLVELVWINRMQIKEYE